MGTWIFAFALKNNQYINGIRGGEVCGGLELGRQGNDKKRKDGALGGGGQQGDELKSSYGNKRI